MSDENEYAVQTIHLSPEQMAMIWISGAYCAISREMSFIEDAVFALRIKDAIREGKRTAEEIAMRALELEGWQPRWVTCGELSRIEVDPLPTPTAPGRGPNPIQA